MDNILLDIWNMSGKLKFREVLNDIQTPIAITDPNLDDNPIVFVNNQFCSMTGYSREQIIGENCRFLQGEHTDPEAVKKIREAIRTRQSIRVEILNYTATRVPFWNELKISPIFNKKGDCLYFIGIQTDSTLRVHGEQRRLESMKEIELAKQIQNRILSQPVHEPDLSIDACFMPSADLNGDMYYWCKLNDQKYGIFLMDVMGSGISSALINMSIRSTLIEVLKLSDDCDPVPVMQRLNDHMVHLFETQEGQPTYFFTAIYMILNVKEKSIEYVNAGHPPAMAVIDETQFTSLTSTTVPLGLLDNPPMEKNRFFYERSLSILLYTDGLIELSSRSLEAEITRLKEIFIRSRQEPVNEERVKWIVEQQLKDHELPLDDICLISVEAASSQRS